MQILGLKGLATPTLFSTLFSVFHLLMKHCLSCLTYITSENTRDTIPRLDKDIRYFFVLRFFEKNPEYQRLFPEFKDVPPSELEKTNALYGHAKRVMKAVENAVSALDDAESFAAYLDELGRRHKARALKPTYLDVSGSYNLLHLFFAKYH